MCVRAPGVSREMREKPEHTQLYHSGWMFPIKQLNQPPNDSFHRHLGNYRSLLFTSGDQTTGWGCCLVGNAKTEQKVRECKTKRQKWRWRRGCNELNLTAVIALVQEKLHFHWADESLVCEWRKQSWLMWKNKRRRQKGRCRRPFKERSERKCIKSSKAESRCVMEDQEELASMQAPPSGELKPAINTFSGMMDLQQILDLFNIDLTKGRHFWVSKKLHTQ